MEFVTWHIHLFVFSWRVYSYVWHDHLYVFHFAYPCMLMHYIFPIPMHVYNERTYTFVIMYIYTHVYLERDEIGDMTHSFMCIFVTVHVCIMRESTHSWLCEHIERWNLWHVTFIHVYFCDACIHTCDMMGHIYIHVFGCDASASSFLCVIGLYHVC